MLSREGIDCWGPGFDTGHHGLLAYSTQDARAPALGSLGSKHLRGANSCSTMSAITHSGQVSGSCHQATVDYARGPLSSAGSPNFFLMP